MCGWLFYSLTLILNFIMIHIVELCLILISKGKLSILKEKLISPSNRLIFWVQWLDVLGRPSMPTRIAGRLFPLAHPFSCFMLMSLIQIWPSFSCLLLKIQQNDIDKNYLNRPYVEFRRDLEITILSIFCLNCHIINCQ